jgi:hypothetical protein
MLDDRVCPSCQVTLPAGRSICPKCGRAVAPAKTGLDFIDLPRKIYAALVEYFGPVGAGIVAGTAFLVLLALFIGLALTKLIPAQ